VDDIVFQKMTLRNLFLDGMAYFGNVANPDNPASFETDVPMIMRFTKNIFFQGSFNMMGHTNIRDASAGIAYAALTQLTPKPSGSITGIVDYRVRVVNVCVMEVVWNQVEMLYEDCPFQEGQDSCPRKGPFCPNVTDTNDQNKQCTLPENGEGFPWRGNVLNDDCMSDADCGDPAEIDANKGQKCRISLVCLTGAYAGELCAEDSMCCAKQQITDCEHKCHGTEQYKLREEKGGFHTKYYRNVYLNGCQETPTNAFLCSHNVDGIRVQCSNITVSSQAPVCPHGGLSCCCDADGSCNDGSDAWCCREDCPGGRGTSCTKAQPGDDDWLNVEDVVGKDMDGLKYTSFWSENITRINKILLPDASGTILTSGNMRELASIFLDITDGRVEVGGHAGFAGDMQFGCPSGAGKVKLHGWFDGTGLTFRTAAACASVVFSGSTRYPDAMGIYHMHVGTHHRKPVWKHLSSNLYIFYNAHEGVDDDGADQCEGRWFLGSSIGANPLGSTSNPLLMRMAHMFASPVDADRRFPGPTFAGEMPGTWQVWIATPGKGRWQLQANVTTHCLTTKHSQDHLWVSMPRHASKDKALRLFLRTQPFSRSLPIGTEQEDFINHYEAEQHDAPLGQTASTSVGATHSWCRQDARLTRRAHRSTTASRQSTRARGRCTR